MYEEESSFGIIPITVEQSLTITRIALPLNVLSILASSIGCLVFIFIRISYPRLADRVIFRLAFAAMLSDIFYSSFQVLNLVVTTSGTLCILSTWGWVFSTLISVFFIDCIAINLQVIFLHEYEGRRDLEKYYFILPSVFALTLSLLPLTQDMYGFDIPEQICWYRYSGTTLSIVWQWSTLFIWQQISVLYCIIILFAVTLKLRYASSQFNKATNVLLKRGTLITSVVRKVLWFPVVPLISQTPTFLAETDMYFSKSIKYELLLFGFVAASIQDSIELDMMVLNINDENDDDNNEIITNKKPTTTNNISNEIDQQDQERFSSSNLSNPLLIPKPSLVETLKYHLLIRLFDQPKNLDEFVISFVQTSTTSTVNNNLKNTYSKRGNVEIINLKKTRKSSSIEIPSSSDSINNNHDVAVTGQPQEEEQNKKNEEKENANPTKIINSNNNDDNDDDDGDIITNKSFSHLNHNKNTSNSISSINSSIYSSCYSGNSIRGSNQPVNKTNNNDNIHIQFTAVNENTNYDGITIINIDKVEDIVENNNNKEKEDNDDDGDDSKINEIIEIISNSRNEDNINKVIHGSVVMPLLGNATIKAELGRSSWKLLHTMMARFPEHPTEDHKQALRSFIYLFGRLYPCGECATEFQEILSKYPPQVSSREAASQWACAVHNIVNKRLYKKIFDCGLIAEKYKCGCDDDGGDGEIMK
ncbi:13196_t:CDS:10 [Entrophospora sp. SA101]|nr:13196_t:CDS:10 [Entrophospora sp. SA101]